MVYGGGKAPCIRVVGEVSEAGRERLRLVERAVRTWTGELIDLGGRNMLLYYRDLKQGTLDIGPGSLADGGVVDALLSSRTVRLSMLFGQASIAGAARRARAIKAKAAENFEERGLQTLFLAWGMATWTNLKGTAIPAAPVLLRQAGLAARGGTGEDFDVSLPGEWEVNPTLLHLLKTDFQIEFDRAASLDLLDQDLDPPDPVRLFEQFTKTCSAVPGFSVSGRVVLGNFSYAKLPMVLDLETSADTLIGSELVCAIAGDEQARDAVRARHPNVSPSQPDVVPPRTSKGSRATSGTPSSSRSAMARTPTGGCCTASAPSTTKAANAGSMSPSPAHART